MSILLAVVSALAAPVLNFVLGWLKAQGEAQATEAVGQAILNAPRTQADVVDALNKGTF